MSNAVQFTRAFDGTLAEPAGSGIFAGMSTLAEIEAAIEQLPPLEKQTLFSHLAAQLETRETGNSATARSPGLHAGAWEVAADFDAPLPDEFWLGRRA